jgi:predicted AlkP superfamily pyrophosphatase or phosphodiesterase
VSHSASVTLFRSLTRTHGLTRTFVLAGSALALLAGCRTSRPTPASQSRTVVLISLDGFRWDYIQRPEAARLRALAAQGTRAERLIPAFPTKTFPNHYTLVTGLYPEAHGIVANAMRDSALGRFSIGRNPSARDGRWYRGEPIWVTAEKQGVRTATYFWPGSEAEIGGVRPSAYRAFDDTTSRATRVRQVLDWLSLPSADAPRFIAVYFADVDTDGHDFGPSAPQTSAAIARVDSAVGAIMDGIAQLRKPVDVVVASDHGMTEISPNRFIALDELVSMDSLDVIDWSPNASIVPKPGREAYVMRTLTNAHPHLRVYRKADMPAHLHYGRGDRITPIIAMADLGWSIGTRSEGPPSSRGAHGYDNREPDMAGLFIAAGPGLARGKVVPAFGSVHVYSLLAHLLSLRPSVQDGSIDSVRAVLH